MDLEVRKCECPTCDQIFYEWEEAELDECPHCNASFNIDRQPNVIGTMAVVVELDLTTGKVSVPFVGLNP